MIQAGPMRVERLELLEIARQYDQLADNVERRQRRISIN